MIRTLPPKEQIEDDSNEQEEEEEKSAGGKVSMGCEPNGHLDDSTKRTKELSNLRLSARSSLQLGANRLHRVLAEQRIFYEQRLNLYTPSLKTVQRVARTDSELETAQKAVEAAYMLLENQASELKNTLKQVRMAEIALNPKTACLPAVVVLGVSAPGSTWAVDKIHSQETPFLRVVDTLAALFEAAYSNPDHKNNKLKRPFPPGGNSGSFKKGNKSGVNSRE